MYTLIITTVLGFIIGLIAHSFFENYWEYYTRFGRGLLFACIGLIVGIFLSVCVIEPVYKNRTKVVLLSNLQDNSTTSGSYCLGSGYFNGTFKYAFYYKAENNTDKLGLLDYQNCSIKQTDDTIPKLYIYITEEDTTKLKNKFVFTITKYKYIFVIPKGSIKTDYKLDAQ